MRFLKRPDLFCAGETLQSSDTLSVDAANHSCRAVALSYSQKFVLRRRCLAGVDAAIEHVKDLFMPSWFALLGPVVVGGAGAIRCTALSV